MKLEHTSTLARGTAKLQQLSDSMQENMGGNNNSSNNAPRSLKRYNTDENSNSFSNQDASMQGQSQAQLQSKQQPVRHYEVPNMSSMLYEYTNREKDYVERAFRGGNYQSIRGLPNDIRPFNVGQAVKEKIANTALTSSIIGQNNHVYQELLKGDGGVFSKFQW